MAFGPKILGGGGDLRKVPCYSMNADAVVGIPWGSGDTQTLRYVKSLFDLFALTGGGDGNISDARATIVELTQHLIVINLHLVILNLLETITFF